MLEEEEKSLCFVGVSVFVRGFEGFRDLGNLMI